MASVREYRRSEIDRLADAAMEFCAANYSLLEIQRSTGRCLDQSKDNVADGMAGEPMCDWHEGGADEESLCTNCIKRRSKYGERRLLIKKRASAKGKMMRHWKNIVEE